jgi:uncharacterized glyoxalase superfamily protein PhnB
MKLYTYLNYGGNCQEAFRFYEQHLGGKITMMMTHGQGPNPNVGPPDWKNAILHARMNIGDTELMGADIPSYQPMRNAYLNSNRQQHRGDGANLCDALRRRRDLHAHERDFFRLPVCPAQG